jgi:glycosyltransferase involved in cell wall biosynthesis
LLFNEQKDKIIQFISYELDSPKNYFYSKNNIIYKMSGDRLLISVIIPAYNVEKTLGRCLESVLAQNYAPFEVIVVDNNSKDKTKEIILDFKKNNKKVKYIFEGIKGRTSARNAGIKNADGEIIVMLDADCLVPMNWIWEISGPIIRGEELVEMGPYRPCLDNFWSKNMQKADNDFLKRSLNGSYINHLDTKNFAIRTDLMKKNDV